MTTIKREDAIEAWNKLSKRGRIEFDQVLMTLPSSDATKKKAELKENGDWDCPDVGCDECDHHRSVEWCSLAIPNHEEVDDTYKMVNEAFFEGFDAAEKRYRLLIETIEELDKKSVDRPHGEWIIDTYNMELKCEICGETFRFDNVDEVLDYKEYAKYCLACGARMGGDTK